eukprot:33845-Eustigmatos_ZCMA.PRE.1
MPMRRAFPKDERPLQACSPPFTDVKRWPTYRYQQAGPATSCPRARGRTRSTHRAAVSTHTCPSLRRCPVLLE